MCTGRPEILLFNEGRGAAKRPSPSSRLRFLQTSLENSSEGIFLGCRRRDEVPGKAGGGLGNSVREMGLRRDFTVCLRHPLPLHCPVVFLTSLPPFYYKLMGIG